MKKTIWVAAIALFALAGCKKEDTSVDVSQLTGTWSNFIDSSDPDFTEHNGTEIFTFDGNGAYKATLRNAHFPNIETKIHEGSYSISADGRFLTLFEDTDGDFDGKYSVIQLNSRNMTLKHEYSLTIPFIVYGLTIRSKVRYVKVAY